MYPYQWGQGHHQGMGAQGAGGNQYNGYHPNPQAHTVNNAPSATVPVGIPTGAHHIGSSVAQAGGPIPKTVVDQADMVAREFRKLFEQVEQYCISHFGKAMNNRNPRGQQYPALGDIAVRVNPLNYHRVDNISIRHAIIAEAPSQQAAEGLMAEYTGRVFLTTRLLAKHIQREVLHKRCFSPLNNQVSRNIDAAAFQDGDNTPPAIRHSRLRNVSQRLRELRGYNFNNQPPTPRTLQELDQEEKFTRKEPPKGINNSRADSFWPIAVALFPEKRTNDWNDLHHLVKEAHMLVFDMYTIQDVVADYIFTWPGNGDQFNLEKMAVRGSVYDQYRDSTLLRAEDLEGAKVSFVITPLVEQKVYRANGTLNTKPIVKAQVMVRR